jgi:hypothetical protein
MTIPRRMLHVERNRAGDNIVVYLANTSCEGVKCRDLAKNRVRGWAFVATIPNFSLPNSGKYSE